MASSANGRIASNRIVFIDSRVPDLEKLLAGLRAGVSAFVLEPGSDGLRQIADILTNRRLDDLESISIVSHGRAGELDLGASVLHSRNLDDHAEDLARIGAALAADGVLQLIGCDVAQGAAGRRFIADLSHLTGADVVAATHPVGSAELGGSWTLDAAIGDAVPALPFTRAALDGYQGLLASTAVVTVSGSGSQSQSEGVLLGENVGNNTASINPATGSATPGYEDLFVANANIQDPKGIMVDANSGVYFIVDQQQDSAHPAKIVMGQLADVRSGTTTPTFTTVFADTFANLHFITGYAIDAADNVIYVLDTTNTTAPNADTKLDMISFSGAHFTGTASTSTVVDLSNTVAALHGITVANLAIDPIHHAAYFLASSQSGTAATEATPVISLNQIYKATWTGAVPDDHHRRQHPGTPLFAGRSYAWRQKLPHGGRRSRRVRRPGGWFSQHPSTQITLLVLSRPCRPPRPAPRACTATSITAPAPTRRSSSRTKRKSRVSYKTWRSIPSPGNITSRC